MDTKFIQGILREECARLDSLRNRLADKGTPLNTKEKADVRKALAATWLEDVQSDSSFMFAKGLTDDYIHNVGITIEILKDFT